MCPALTPPTAEDLLARWTCPVDRAAAVSKVRHAFGFVPAELYLLRQVALIEARLAGHKCSYLARRVGLTSARISQLTAGALREATQ